MPSKCRYGRKVTGRRGCKSRPGPKRSRKSRVQPRRRRCSRGMRKGSRVCKRKPGPKRSRVVSRTRRASSKTSVKPNYAKYLYYIKGVNAWQVPRAGMKGTQKIVARNVISKRKPGHLYYLKTNRAGTLSVHSRPLNRN